MRQHIFFWSALAFCQHKADIYHRRKPGFLKAVFRADEKWLSKREEHIFHRAMAGLSANVTERSRAFLPAWMDVSKNAGDNDEMEDSLHRNSIWPFLRHERLKHPDPTRSPLRMVELLMPSFGNPHLNEMSNGKMTERPSGHNSPLV